MKTIYITIPNPNFDTPELQEFLQNVNIINFNRGISVIGQTAVLLTSDDEDDLDNLVNAIDRHAKDVTMVAIFDGAPEDDLSNQLF